jgi:phosphoribosyl 1,2-cyclic phosphodiesterase
MRVRFWGTRGSIPVALTSTDIRVKIENVLRLALSKGVDSEDKLRAFLDNDLASLLPHTYGGHSSCVQIETAGEEFLVCDAGTGIRALGASIPARTPTGAAPTINLLMSHVHWDHIMGFPFFAPAYLKGARIRIHGCHDNLEQAFRLQQSAPCFPVEFSRLAAEVEFVKLRQGESSRIAGFEVTPKLQHHSGDSYGYRLEREGKVIVYSTDSEHKLEDQSETDSFVRFFQDADLVIFDAMYSFLETVTMKEDWGHSSNMVGVELAQMAKVKHLCLFHHEPAFDDTRIHSVFGETIRFEQLTRRHQPLKISSAYDGMEIDV